MCCGNSKRQNSRRNSQPAQQPVQQVTSQNLAALQQQMMLTQQANLQQLDYKPSPQRFTAWRRR